jgi:hypothetical protein
MACKETGQEMRSDGRMAVYFSHHVMKTTQKARIAGHAIQWVAAPEV